MAILKLKNFGRKPTKANPTVKVTDVSPQEAAIEQGRVARGFLPGLVANLENANELHYQAKNEAEKEILRAKEEAGNRIDAANRIKAISDEEIVENSKVAETLRNLGLAG